MMNKSMFINGALGESFKEGTSKLAGCSCYSYMKSDDNTLTINEAEAKIIRRLFEKDLAGDSLGKIADDLAKQRIPSPTGKEKWNR